MEGAGALTRNRMMLITITKFKNYPSNSTIQTQPFKTEQEDRGLLFSGETKLTSGQQSSKYALDATNIKPCIKFCTCWWSKRFADLLLLLSECKVQVRN